MQTHRLKTVVALLLALLLPLGVSRAAETGAPAAPFVHPGLLHTREELAFVRQRIAAGAEPWKTAWERLLREIFYPPIKDFFPAANGNWDASMIQTMLAMGVFLDDRAMFDRAVNYYQRRGQRSDQELLQRLRRMPGERP